VEKEELVKDKRELPFRGPVLVAYRILIFRGKEHPKVANGKARG
jgi:hypothetical protein